MVATISGQDESKGFLSILKKSMRSKRSQFFYCIFAEESPTGLERHE